MPLFWRIFLVNALALTAALLVLIMSPVTISYPTTPQQATLLLIGFAGLLLVNAGAAGEVLRGVTHLRDELAHADDEPIDLPAGSAPELVEVANAHNVMLAKLDEERIATARAALRANEEERSKLAAELHDEVGQNLTFLLMRINSVAKKVPVPLADEVEGLASTARMALEQVRTLSRQLRPGVLEDLGLKPSLASLMDDLRTLGFTAELDFPGWLDPDAERDLAAYRVVQESLTNVVKHSQASEVKVSVKRDGDQLVVTVADNGNGRPGTPGTGTGSMRERARLVGGTFRRDAVPGIGTTVEIAIPFFVSTVDVGPPTRPIPTISMFPPITPPGAGRRLTD